MKKQVLVAIAKRMVHYDRSSATFYVGAFTALTSLLEDFGYTFVRCDHDFCIVDRGGAIVCSVSR